MDRFSKNIIGIGAIGSVFWAAPNLIRTTEYLLGDAQAYFARMASMNYFYLLLFGLVPAVLLAMNLNAFFKPSGSYFNMTVLLIMFALLFIGMVIHYQKYAAMAGAGGQNMVLKHYLPPFIASGAFVLASLRHTPFRIFGRNNNKETS
ncbi:MAG TPA: hypothetical protein DD729_01865 [Rhodobacteraceae bacterium]|jgi:hypothetical protein|nr:hypothetical protein [Paracoccaceae bacterium]